MKIKLTRLNLFFGLAVILFGVLNSQAFFAESTGVFGSLKGDTNRFAVSELYRNIDDLAGKLDPFKNDEGIVPDFEFVDFDGKKRKFSEFKGKVVLIDFWATWCGPCLADIPKLKKLREQFKGKGFEILGMNTETIGDDDADDPEFAREAAARAREIVRTRGIEWPQADSESSLPVAVKIFGVTALPTKVLVGSDGKIIARLGEKDDAEKIIAELLSAGKSTDQ